MYELLLLARGPLQHVRVQRQQPDRVEQVEPHVRVHDLRVAQQQVVDQLQRHRVLVHLQLEWLVRLLLARDAGRVLYLLHLKGFLGGKIMSRRYGFFLE